MSLNNKRLSGGVKASTVSRIHLNFCRVSIKTFIRRFLRYSDTDGTNSFSPSNRNEGNGSVSRINNEAANESAARFH